MQVEEVSQVGCSFVYNIDGGALVVWKKVENKFRFMRQRTELKTGHSDADEIIVLAGKVEHEIETKD